jgi:hypothetical protein
LVGLYGGNAIIGKTIVDSVYVQRMSFQVIATEALICAYPYSAMNIFTDDSGKSTIVWAVATEGARPTVMDEIQAAYTYG